MELYLLFNIMGGEIKCIADRIRIEIMYDCTKDEIVHGKHLYSVSKFTRDQSSSMRAFHTLSCDVSASWV